MSVSDGVAPKPGLALVMLAGTLERLTARVGRELDPEASECDAVTDPRLAESLAELVAYAEGCREVIDDPVVFAALEEGQGARSGQSAGLELRRC